MSRFANLKSAPSPAAVPAAVEVKPAPGPVGRAKARDGKVQVAGFFSPELRRTLHLMALDPQEEGESVQALLGEAIDMLLRARGRHPMGER